MPEVNRVQGSAEFGPPIWRVSKLGDPERKRGCVRGHTAKPAFFSTAPCPARRGKDPQTVDFTLKKWKNLDLKDGRSPWLRHGRAV